MDNLSAPLRVIFRLLLGKVPFAETLTDILKNTTLTPDNAEQIGVQMANTLGGQIEKEVIDASFRPFLLTLLFNFGVFGLVHYFV